MRFSRTLFLVITGLVLVAGTPGLMGNQLPVSVKGAFALLITVGVVRHLKKWPTPSWLTPFLGVTALFLMGIQGLFFISPAIAVIGFGQLLLGIRYLTRDKAISDQHLILLAFLMILAATIGGLSISFALLFVAFVALLPPAMVMVHLHKEMEQRFAAKEGGELVRLRDSKRVVSFFLLLQSTLAAIPILLISAVLFAIMPRLGFGLGGGMGGMGTPAGFTREVTVGDLQKTIDQETTFLRVWPVARTGAPRSKLNWLFRGAVFDHYQQGRWNTIPTPPLWPLPNVNNEVQLAPRQPIESRAILDILQRPNDENTLFLPLGATRLTTNPLLRNGIRHPRAFKVNEQAVVHYEDPFTTGIRYRVQTGRPLARLTPPKNPRELTAVPATMTDLVTRAKTVAGNGSKRQQMNRIVRYLTTRYRYARTLPAPAPVHGRGHNDVVERFLFDNPRGNCEYFASAATLMLRAIGIPARLITGFAGGVWNRTGGYYTVKASAAHAWSEAWIDGQWETVDATPPATAAEGNKPLDTVAGWLDTLEFKWQQWVIRYNFSTQKRLWRATVGKMKPASLRLPWRLFSVLVGLALGLLLLWRLVKKFRIPWPSWWPVGGAKPLSPATKLFRQLEKRLGKQGISRPGNQTPAHFVAVHRPLVNRPDLLDEILAAHQLARYGGQPLSAGQLARLQKMISLIEIANQHGKSSQNA